MKRLTRDILAKSKKDNSNKLVKRCKRSSGLAYHGKGRAEAVGIGNYVKRGSVPRRVIAFGIGMNVIIGLLLLFILSKIGT